MARRRVAAIAALTALLALPLVVALLAFREPTWTPVLDLAQTELRVRDVGTSHTPLVGLPGRILHEGAQGSHPGPLSFYALAPVYRLVGASPFALQAATVVVHVVAIVVALVIARRRGGLPLLLGVAAGIAVLVNAFGVTTLTEPWNPYLPLLWWLVVLLAVWSVVCGDVVLLPVAVAAASFCAQTHVPYFALSVGVGVLVAGALVLQLRRAEPAHRPRLLRWTGASVALGLVLWLPPLVDQWRHRPGNFSILLHYFTEPPPAGEATAGLGEAVKHVLRHLDVFHLTVDQLAHPSLLVENDPTRHPSLGRGIVLLVLWLAAAAYASRTNHAGVKRLHLVTGVALVLAVIATSRIFGEVWFYLLLSIWTAGSLALAAIVWTVAIAMRGRLAADRLDRFARIGLVVLVAVAVLFSARATWSAPSADHSDATVVDELAHVVPGTVAALDKDERYLVAWDDAAFFGSPGYGMLNELDRRDFDVGVIEGLGAIATTHRVVPEADAFARVQIVTGKYVDAWRQVRGAREVAFYDPRSPEERARFEQLRTEVIGLLREQGLSDAVTAVDDNLFAVSIHPRAGRDIRSRVEEMLVLGVPIAVFVAPPDARRGP